MSSMQLYTEPIVGAPNFTIAELCKSSTADKMGIGNKPSKLAAQNLEYLAKQVLQPIRDHFGVPIKVTSGYRSPALNKAVGGSETSFHSHGMAADIQFTSAEKVYTLFDIFTYVYEKLEYTELIAEELPNGWIHVAIARGREDERQLKYKMAGGIVRRSDYDSIKHLFSM